MALSNTEMENEIRSKFYEAVAGLNSCLAKYAATSVLPDETVGWMADVYLYSLAMMRRYGVNRESIHSMAGEKALVVSIVGAESEIGDDDERFWIAWYVWMQALAINCGLDLRVAIELSAAQVLENAAMKSAEQAKLNGALH